ncbi:hypothetical protein E1B28_009971 [Marasmius oreades]|uniref:Uncharacterized protein n=1 Tax=Marasmius oreades TaxID=181124 RepID=A0A9P7RWV9_9AGAR|nr:uncharacterized protein E1B28_009971 [Marasmius oreades]KAG7090892.1 hypothetical protein E1B28_009971 [Marasmius oreades]
MAPKGGHKAALRPHSRTSSVTKIATNLQFTQKEQVSRNPDRPKLKNGHDGHSRPAIPSRVSSKDQLAPLNKRPLLPPATRSKPAFTVTVGPEDGEGDEDEWVSSESGINTPNPVDGSGSEDELDNMATPVEVHRNPLHNRAVASTEPSGKADSNSRMGAQMLIPRVDPLRPNSGFDTAQVKAGTTSNTPPSLVVRPRAEELPVSTAPLSTVEPEPLIKKARPASMVLQGSQFESSSLDARPTAPRLTTKRQASTRPPSTHSISSKHDHAALRPHPLIRGHSFGQPAAPSRPAPLAPLTTSDAASTVPSSSPTSLRAKPPGSPSTISASPTSPYPQSAIVGPNSHPRRTSVSSARSVATLPVLPSAREFTRPSRDRNRTLSTISQSSSSAAISSLAHLPTVTRPPTPQMISFFPPVNTHHTVEGIHPLLPPPYLSNHLTVLAYRTPLRESYDRILKAKAAR